MKGYADMHCDSLTACAEAGGSLSDFNGQVNAEKLKKAGCALQCFAVFTEGADAREKFEKAVAFYNRTLAECGDLRPALCSGDILKAKAEGKCASVLTVENLGFLESAEEIKGLAGIGVKMASLVWNTPNKFAYPNFFYAGGEPDFYSREERGLTEHGKAAVCELNKNRIIIDVSHLSDGGTEDILNLSNAPVVASHSNAHGVCGVSRNLTDVQIRKIADKGGVVGVNFCADFVGGDDIFSGVYRHVKRIIDVGGEDAVAIGSDFDGMPAPEGLEDCEKTAALFEYLERRGIKGRALDKLLFENFFRVFKEVCG